MKQLDQLVTFTLELPHGEAWSIIEDVVYNCLDFCTMNQRSPHFILLAAGEGACPDLWPLLEVLRQEAASFSLLTEPEKTQFEAVRSDVNTVYITISGIARRGETIIGNLLEDRLADLWVMNDIAPCKEEIA